MKDKFKSDFFIDKLVDKGYSKDVATKMVFNKLDGTDISKEERDAELKEIFIKAVKNIKLIKNDN